ncbi:gliding motility-associated ABC transporter substrate-binding protein GldG [Hugenholtzia roseola]|uniref:gliding motility-associated ABC transporter substrate-binding protein GldG n=1 Tax=Hugenholtzia roseola TaxID=1002 RepID=UPI000686062E|nr:gliding motility-associated ABC transporter substrate-binding protein GldG [Hugenholtzia roseola]
MQLSQKLKWEAFLEILVLILVLILLNLAAQRYFFRIDLTQEKRYTLSQASIQILENLEEPVYIDVYLEGDLNASFKRLQKNLKETLEEFKTHAGSKIQFRFIDPESIAPDDKNQFYSDLARRGVPPTNLFDTQDGKKIQKIIFPGAILSYKNKETGVLLLKGNQNASPQEQLNQSIENLEYELMAAIKKMSQKQKQLIGIIEGHDELSPTQMIDAERSLSEFYAVERLNLSRFEQKAALQEYDAIILAQPKKAFSEKETYLLDQYLMQGGNLLLFIDQIQMNLDSIALEGTYAFAYDLKLLEMVFRYGVRLNQDMVQDVQSGNIVVNVGNIGNRPNLQRVPFPYYVVANKFEDHPITKNLGAVYLRFAGSLDTVRTAAPIQKTPLIFSSEYSRIKRAPTLISLEELKSDLVPELYQTPHLPLAYLLEGNFNSAFAGRFPPEPFSKDDFIEKGQYGKVFICADGDVLLSEMDKKTGNPLPLGYEPISGQTYSHKDLLLNVLAYMLDAEGIIAARSKEIVIRQLDPFQVQDDQLFWQTFNLVLPLIVILCFGLIWYGVRKRRFGK